MKVSFIEIVSFPLNSQTFGFNVGTMTVFGVENLSIEVDLKVEDSSSINIDCDVMKWLEVNKEIVVLLRVGSTIWCVLKFAKMDVDLFCVLSRLVDDREEKEKDDVLLARDKDGEKEVVFIGGRKERNCDIEEDLRWKENEDGCKEAIAVDNDVDEEEEERGRVKVGESKISEVVGDEEKEEY